MFRDDCRDFEPQNLGEWSHSLRKESGGKRQHTEMDELLDLIIEKPGVVFLSQAKNPGSVRSFEGHGPGKQLLRAGSSLHGALRACHSS